MQPQTLTVALWVHSKFEDSWVFQNKNLAKSSRFKKETSKEGTDWCQSEKQPDKKSLIHWHVDKKKNWRKPKSSLVQTSFSVTLAVCMRKMQLKFQEFYNFSLHYKKWRKLKEVEHFWNSRTQNELLLKIMTKVSSLFFLNIYQKWHYF